MWQRLLKSFFGHYAALSKPVKLIFLILTALFLRSALKGKRSRSGKTKAKKRVAVIGSGIAGIGAAYTLASSNIDVVVYEKKPSFGGNAKSYTWDFGDFKVRSGLAVLAWPEEFFHNYNALIKSLGISTFKHPLRFLITSSEDQREDSVKLSFAHEKMEEMPDWAVRDLEKWTSMAGFVRRVNSFFQPSSYPSLYRASLLNPLNLISLRRLCQLFGLSSNFWDLIFVPLHTSTFLELDLDSVPAVMAETLEDIMPLTRTPSMLAWEKDANQPIRSVLELPMVEGRRSCCVDRVEYFSNKRGETEVFVTDEDLQTQKFDAVVFACSARSMTKILQKGNPANGQSWLRNWLENLAFDGTLYSHDRDPNGTFDQGVVHKHGSVLPGSFRREILDSYCNYMEVDRKNSKVLENTFVISSWAPTVQNTDGVAAAHFKKTEEGMFVSYNCRKKLEGKEAEWSSTSREAHPSLTTWQLFASQFLWPRLQGSREGSTYFCGSAVTPGNGHDLSLLSGIVAAVELGAKYPFSDEAAEEDFRRLRKMMLPLFNDRS